MLYYNADTLSDIIMSDNTISNIVEYFTRTLSIKEMLAFISHVTWYRQLSGLDDLPKVWVTG
jgi:hypothetical protein